MARMFKPKYPKRKMVDGKRVTVIRDGETVYVEAAKWYVEYRDAQDVLRRVPGYKDKAATQQLASRLERQAAREQSGLVDRYAEHRKRPLIEHIEDWKQALLDKGATESYAALSNNRVQAVLEGTKAVFWPDLDPNRVASYLAERRTKGLSIESSNHYLRRAKQFSRWMVRSRRAPENSLESLQLMNPQTDRRHDRRALKHDELRKLIQAARNGPQRGNISGQDRAIAYRLAAECGLRVREIRHLTPESFQLDDVPPTVTVSAAYSKHRQCDVQPLSAIFMHFGTLSLPTSPAEASTPKLPKPLHGIPRSR